MASRAALALLCSEMQRVLTVLGARPQFVKAAVVSRALSEVGVTERIVHTGQHYDASMSEVFFEELGIPAPARNLGISGGRHGEQTGAMLSAVERAILEEDAKPDWVLVYGDTNSTLAGALAAAKLHVPVAHVEAGLRSGNRRMPEEVNRVLVDHLSSLLLCPTSDSLSNLLVEGIGLGSAAVAPRARVELVGDVMHDATLVFGGIAESRSSAPVRLGVDGGGHLLVTVHRAENTDDLARLRVIVEAVTALAEQMPVVWPVHPRARGLLAGLGLRVGGGPGRLRLCEPVGYLDMLALERRARCILTDSGGVQKEAFFAGVPCVTVRDQTEWVELVRGGWNAVVPPIDPAAVVAAVERARPGLAGMNPYGDGQASRRIASILAG
jgi:UDP-GlcNAc3NAcA epimerase